MKRLSAPHKAKKVAYDETHEEPIRQHPKNFSKCAVSVFEKTKIASMAQSQRSRCLKTGGVLVFIVLLTYFLHSGGSNFDRVTDLSTEHAVSKLFSGTTKCTKPADESKPIIQYVLMIDAGSTGSRIHVYKFNNCGPTPELELEEFKMTEKKPGGSGLSSYKEDTDGAAKSLDVLMDVAMKTVPDELKSCTPIAVKATAGLRLLGPEMSQAILDAVRNRLEIVYPFPVVSNNQNGVAIMDGKDEGVYAWITANYLLGKIGSLELKQTAAIFDLGGGSTQIVFEPSFNVDTSEKLPEGEHRYDLRFGGQNYELYQHSHLGYGLMSARETIHKTLIQDIYQSNSSDTSWISQPIINPCITSGMSRKIEIKLGADHKLGESVSVNMTGPSSPLPAQCRRLAEKILFKDARCAVAPCSFNGVYQPSLSATFAQGDIYTFSYFFDRINPLGMPESFTLNELLVLTNKVCGGESEWDIFKTIPGALDELRGRPEHCLDLNFIITLLHTGYEMPINREIKIVKKIKYNELGWCLGASLPLLSNGSGWQCRIDEIS